jgi:tripartite-type tricarboxylate transporter receptor subunit TctC
LPVHEPGPGRHLPAPPSRRLMKATLGGQADMLIFLDVGGIMIIFTAADGKGAQSCGVTRRCAPWPTADVEYARRALASASLQDRSGGIMKLPHRRQFLHLVAGAAALPAVSRVAWTQTYPSRPVRIIVGFPAGGANDIHARLIGQWLSERLGQPVIVENRPGAVGNLATEFVVRAEPDGHTLLLLSTSNAVNASLYENLSFNLARDITPISALTRGGFAMVVTPSLPVNTVSEFIAYAKANPGKINMASSGNGGAAHMSGEFFKMLTGVDLFHVPYRGDTPALTDLMAGQVHVFFATIAGSIETIRTGKIRALAVSTQERSPALPNIPTIREDVSGYEVTGWAGIGAPKGTPASIVNKLNAEINAGMASPAIAARYAVMGATAAPGTPAEFSMFIAQETEKWAKVVKFSGAKPD